MIQFKGIIKNIFESEVFGNFEKRVFWLQEKEGTYPNTWQLEMHQNDCNILDKFKAGQEVVCNVEVRGRSYTKNGSENVFNTLKCIKIERVDKKEEMRTPNGNSYDDLPF